VTRLFKELMVMFWNMAAQVGGYDGFWSRGVLKSLANVQWPSWSHADLGA